MSDIISEISRISEDESRMQIALIDNVNILMRLKRPDTGWLMCLQMLPIHLHRV